MTGKGFAMDYTLLSSQTNLVLQSDTTYYVSGIVNINGVLTIEGGTVVKYTNTSVATITASNVVCKTGQYRIAAFTAKDDDTIGQKIGGSTGNPSGYYAGTALDLSTAPSAITLSNLRFHYVSNAVAGASTTLQDSQLVRCRNAFAAGSTQPTVNNVLAYLLNGMLANTAAGTFTAVNLTAHYCTNFFGNTSGTVRLTNCLFAAVTNWQCTTTQTNYDAIVNSDTGVFQTVGTAIHYLAADSPYRNAGTTGIDAGLLARLKKKTTYPPVVYGPQTVTVPTTFSAQAQRDTDTPDLGFHYDPIDYAICAFYATNAAITVNPGAALGFFGTNAFTYGFGLGGSASLNCQGTPTALAEFCAFNTVQEQANTNWASPSYALITDGFTPADAGAYVRFADFSVLAQEVPHFYGLNTSLFVFQDCQFHGGQFDSFENTIVLTNCLFERVYTDIEPSDGRQAIYRNNLFWQGSFYFWPQDTNSIIADNLFDSPTISNLGGLAYKGGFNAYITNHDELTPTLPTDKVLTTPPSYQVGPLGNYYLLSSSTLINADTNTLASQVGLYHYTVMTNLVSGNEIKETNSLLDISYHYVATDSSGNPIDTNGDGNPDYLSDINGNGSVESGEISWNSPGDLGLKVLITRPKNGSTVP
ncbi:MAG TPA: hypothetical protein VFE51_23270 [Verrucomicrobiae bacterium]|nr:hypothetical protein [Verrucomicrobiae bacterium]